VLSVFWVDIPRKKDSVSDGYDPQNLQPEITPYKDFTERFARSISPTVAEDLPSLHVKPIDEIEQLFLRGEKHHNGSMS